MKANEILSLQAQNYFYSRTSQWVYTGLHRERLDVMVQNLARFNPRCASQRSRKRSDEATCSLVLHEIAIRADNHPLLKPGQHDVYAPLLLQKSDFLRSDEGDNNEVVFIAC